MQNKIILYLIIFGLLSCGASTKTTASKNPDERPNWIDNPTSSYPDSKYLTATGLADTKTAAEDNARGNISKIFQSKINLDQTLIENVTETETEFSKSMNMLTNTNVKSNQTLKNIKIGESWFSPNEGRYYVLAYLNSMETAMIYTEEMDQNLNIAQNAYKKSSEQSSAFARYAYLSKGKDALAINKLLEGQLRIISPHTAYMQEEGLENKVSESLRKAKDEITCAVIVEGEMADDVAASLRALIAKFGFPVVDTADRSKLVFRANVKVDPTTLSTPGTFYLYYLTIDMEDRINNNSLETYTVQGREGHVNESSAKGRVIWAMNKKIEKEYYKKINKYIKSYVE